MAFPSSPSNGAVATVNGITYSYNSTKTAWLRTVTVGTNLVANSLAVTSNTSSISSTSGAMIITGGAGVGGNLNIGGVLGAPSASIVGGVVAGNITTYNVVGTYLTGTILTAAQPNITSVGTLSSLTASGNTQISSLGVGTAASGVAGEIRATNAITSYYSDDRLKTNLGNIPNALDKVLTLNGFYYEANEVAQSLGYAVKREVGVSAQQVEAVLPESTAPAPIDANYLTVQYERLIPLLIEAIKELKHEVDTLKQRIGE